MPDVRRPPILLVGQSGMVAQRLLAGLGAAGYEVAVLGGRQACGMSPRELASHCQNRLVAVAVLEFASAAVVDKIPATSRVLDVSPAFRQHPEWVYGASYNPADGERVRAALRVANPGCFATAALILLRPLRRANLIGDGPVYLDAVGGASAGGEALIESAGSAAFDATSVFSMTREHRHVVEIAHHARLAAPVWFSPKIGLHESGLIMQVPLPGISRSAALGVLHATYASTEVRVHDDSPNRLSATTWAGRDGAGVWVLAREGGSVALCCLDNLREGSVTSALRNIHLMLSGGAT